MRRISTDKETQFNTTRDGLAETFRTHPHTSGIIVSPSHRFIYMKPAKTAGTSILRATLEQTDCEIIHRKDHPERFEKWLAQISDAELKDYFIFTVTRNPWDRFVSNAAYFGIDFREFIANFDEHRKDEQIGIHTLPIHVYSHMEGVRFVDTICRFETLQADMNLILDRLGLERRNLPLVNKSKHKPFSEYYTAEDAEKLAEIYNEDIKLFGYAFDATLSQGHIPQHGTKQNLVDTVRSWFGS